MGIMWVWGNEKEIEEVLIDLVKKGVFVVELG